MEGKFDKRNQINDLTGKEWLKLTRSFWVSEKCGADKFSYQHPAPFMIKDVEKLISMFTKKGMCVLDPFCGIGTTIVACQNTGRTGIGIELSPDYFKLMKERMLDYPQKHKIILGDSLEKIPKIRKTIDYCVTSPPYHNILRNNGEGLRAVKTNGARNGARSGVEYYSNDNHDLGNQETFDDFLALFGNIMAKVHKKLKARGYASIIISDFTISKKETNVAGGIIGTMTELGFEFCGTTVLLQNNKPLYPFGYPYAYKINHHHQNIITFRKTEL